MDSGDYQLPATTVSFGGNSYAASSVYLEADSPDGSCVANPSGATIRLFFDSAPFTSGVINWSVGGGALPTVPPSSGDISFAYVDVESVDGEITSGTVVPEPSTFVLLASGLAAVAARRRRWR